MQPSPLAHAAELAALHALAKRPDPASLLGQATDPGGFTIRVAREHKQAFDAVQRAAGVVARARLTQARTLGWLLAFALENEAAFLAAVARRP